MRGVAVVGLGLIGGSVALALKGRGYDADPDVRAAARRRGIDTADTLAEAVGDADVVVAAVSTEATPALLVDLSAAAPGALLTDTASLKRPIVAAAHQLRVGVRFVAGHPMAGSQRQGVDAASAELFLGRPWILARTARSDEASIGEISELVRAAGARPVLLDAERHDGLMTWASHLPFAVAAALARTAEAGAGSGLSDIAGPGLLDATRTAGQPLPLALELALADPAALAAALDALGGRVAELSAALRSGDRAAVSAFVEKAAAARRSLEGRQPE
jgi:prephenate dehydrogenase